MRLAPLALTFLLAAPARADVCTWPLAAFGRWSAAFNRTWRDTGARVPTEVDLVVHSNGQATVVPTVAVLADGPLTAGTLARPLTPIR